MEKRWVSWGIVLPDFHQGTADGGGDLPGAVTTEPFIDLFESSDKLDDLPPLIGTSRRLTKMGATSEGASLVDHAA